MCRVVSVTPRWVCIHCRNSTSNGGKEEVGWVDANGATLEDGTATGIHFEEPSPEALLFAVERTLRLYEQPKLWKRMATQGMRQDFSWNHSAREYLALYEKVLAGR